MANYTLPQEILSNDETTALITKWQADRCAESRDRVILHNMRLVLSIAHKFGYKNRESHDDIVHQGIVGLMDSIDRFDPSMEGSRFSVYCYRYVRGYMLNLLNNRFNAMVSASAPSFGEEGARSIEDNIASRSDVAAESTDSLDFDVVRAKLDELTDVERTVIIRYFGLVSGQKETFEAIGESIGMTKMGVCIAVKRALRKLRAALVD